MDVDHLIAELNDECVCVLAPSKIHGIGVFALRDVKKGDKLHCIFDPRQIYEIPYDRFNEIRPEIREIILGRYPGVIRARSSCRQMTIKC